MRLQEKKKRLARFAFGQETGSSVDELEVSTPIHYLSSKANTVLGSQVRPG